MFLSAKKFSLKITSVFFFISFLFFARTALSANLNLSPSSGSYNVGDTVTVRVVLSSPDQSANAVSGLVSFPTSLFYIQSVSKTNSVLNFWVTEPAISTSAGTVNFEGVALNGFTGSSGTIITINLRATKVGSGQVSFRSGQILANDGAGTDITKNLTGATFSVKEGAAKPKPAPLEPEEETIPELQPAPTLRAPEIAGDSKYGAQAILGTSDYPRAQTLLTFSAEDGTRVFIVGTAEADGSFNILVPNSLKRGTYTVTSVMVKEDKTNSEISNTIIIKVGSILDDVDFWVWLLIILLVLAVIYLILRTHVHFLGYDSSEHINKHKLRDTEEIVHKSFDILREDITDYDNAKLTATEHKRMAGIKKDISDAEKIIDKKIKDLE